ncbi:unnamed protein product [Sympodiomycopsis kandeliae]
MTRIIAGVYRGCYQSYGSTWASTSAAGRIADSLVAPARRFSSSYHSSVNKRLPGRARPALALGSQSLRSFSSSSRNDQYRFMLALAVQGKPGEPDLETQEDGRVLDPQTGKPLPEEMQAMAKEVHAKRKEKNDRKIGWPSDTPIGQWRDSLLGEAQAGEDSVMVAQTSAELPSDVAIGVADGVGSWSENGVDPALFSQALMYHASSLFSAESSAAASGSCPKTLLTEAFRRVQKEKDIPAGSSTATILTMEASTGILRTANLGDSGFMILRDESKSADADAEQPPTSAEQQKLDQGFGASGRRPLEGTFYRSSPQQYTFNAPFQLSKLPPKMLEDWKRQAREAGQDESSVSLDSEPSKADEYTCQLKHGDIVVVATDGVWDNVWGKEWVALVKFLKEQHHQVFQTQRDEIIKISPEAANDEWLEEKTLVNVIAHNALQYTLHCQFSEKKRSPFEAEAEKHRIKYPGGKVDDVGIVVGLIIDENVKASASAKSAA